MEARHAVQGLIRSAACSAWPTAGLCVTRRSPLLQSVRFQSSSSASAPAPAAPTSPKPSERWTRPRSLDPAASYSGPSTIGGGGRHELSLQKRLNLPSRTTGGMLSSMSSILANKDLTNRKEYFDVQTLLGNKNEDRERRRLVPSLGREVVVNRAVDPAKAFGLLSIAVRQNKVPRDVRLQRFHERPGMKRKRLKSERWRARFKFSFRQTVSRVRELAKQGW